MRGYYSVRRRAEGQWEDDWASERPITVCLHLSEWMTYLHICVTIKTCFYPSCIHKLKSEMGIYPLSTLTLLQSVTPIEELAQLLYGRLQFLALQWFRWLHTALFNNPRSRIMDLESVNQLVSFVSHQWNMWIINQSGGMLSLEEGGCVRLITVPKKYKLNNPLQFPYSKCSGQCARELSVSLWENGAKKCAGKQLHPPRRAYPTTNANVQEIEGDFYLYQFLKQFTG